LDCKHAGGYEITLNCPFCVGRGTTQDTRYRLGINVRYNLCHCFNCHFKSRDALRDLKVTLIHDFPEEPAEPKKPERELPEDYEPLNGPKGAHWQKVAWRYLVKRRLAPRQIRRHEIGISLVGRAHHRVIFPIYGNRKLRGWSGRSIVEATPKWLHSHGMEHAYSICKMSDAGRVVVVTEGIFDSLAVARATKYRTPSVALMGTRLTVQKYKAIADYRKVVLWLDPDEAGMSAMSKIGADLADRGHAVTFVVSDEDAGDLKQSEIHRALMTAKPWTAAAQNLWLSGARD